MQLKTAQNASFGLKIAFGAGWGFLIIGNLPGAILGGLMAYVLLAIAPKPFKTFKESLRVNWRAFCFFFGLVGLAILAFAFHNAEAMTVCRSFQAGFVGVICGEILSNALYLFVKDDKAGENKADKKDDDSSK